MKNKDYSIKMHYNKNKILLTKKRKCYPNGWHKTKLITIWENILTN
jgi:hypothetical protein